MKSLTKFGAVLGAAVLLAVGSARADEGEDPLKALAQAAINEANALKGPSSAALASAYCARVFAESGYAQTNARYTLAKINTNMGNDVDACALVDGYLGVAAGFIASAITEYGVASDANAAGFAKLTAATTLFQGGAYGQAITVAGQAKGNFTVSITQSNLCSADAVAAGDPCISAMGIINSFLPPPPGGG